MRALRIRTAPVRAGITHWSTLSWRWALATSSGVSPLGSVPPSTGTLRPSPAWSSLAPRARDQAVAARAAPVRAVLATLATRSRCLGSSTSAAAPFSPTAPISEPPNQAARPRSCRERETVLSAATVLLLHGCRAMGRGCRQASGPSSPTCAVRPGDQVADQDDEQGGGQLGGRT